METEPDSGDAAYENTRPTVQKPRGKGVWLVDEQEWLILRELVGLPPNAHRKLNGIVVEFRVMELRPVRGTPSQARAALARLAATTRKLAEGMRALKDCEPAMNSLLFAGMPPGTGLLTWDFKAFFETKIQELDSLALLLEKSRADAEAHGPGKPGPSDSLRLLTRKLDQFLIEETGRGLVRSTARKRGSPAQKCRVFVGRIADLVYGDPKESTIDAAIKTAINNRLRRVA
jgi:hypothetical protein